MRRELQAAVARWRLVPPQVAPAGRIGERLGRGTGSSLEFTDFRDYSPGDDLRRVDWRGFARTDQLRVRLYREEVAPALDVVIDASASMSSTPEKEQALRDLVEACVFWSLRAGGQPRRLHAGGEVLDAEAQLLVGGEDARSLVPAAPLRPRGVRVLVSDFLRPADPAPDVRLLASGAAQLVVLQLLDPWELQPQVDGEARTLVDVESAQRLDAPLDARTVGAYVARLARLTAGLERAVQAAGGRFARVAAAPPAAMFHESLLPAGVLEPAP
ncbi:MAG TPA: DUF58 domain-containing protein [Planctomycetota bacterium]|nr:DUF58 domain-containing protein [Planctomycetota bacterium]